MEWDALSESSFQCNHKVRNVEMENRKELNSLIIAVSSSSMLVVSGVVFIFGFFFLVSWRWGGGYKEGSEVECQGLILALLD